MRFQVHSLERTDALRADTQTAERLVELVRRAVGARRAPTVAVVVRESRIHLIQLRPLVEARASLARFLAALTRSEAPGGPPEAVGLVGTVRMRRGRGAVAVPAALVFLEWADCRWWHWQALLDGDNRQILDSTETVRSALDGDPLPSGLGRWWSVGRRTGVSVRFGEARVVESAVVH